MDALFVSLTAMIVANPTFAAMFIIAMIIVFVILTLVHINTLSLLNASNDFIKKHHLNWYKPNSYAQNSISALVGKIEQSDMKLSLGEEMSGMIILKDIADGRLHIRVHDNGASPATVTLFDMRKKIDPDKVRVEIRSNNTVFIQQKGE